VTKDDRPFPPGDYQVVVVGSGPGGLQTSYYLRRLGIRHALISSDAKPGGMFQRFPVFQRLITWTKLHAPAQRDNDHYEWFDWNSLLAEESEHRSIAPAAMDGTSYFPARDEMERQIADFVVRTELQCRYGCKWESTRRMEDDRYILTTSDGEYRCEVLVIATGMAEPWKPTGIKGIESVPHYVDLASPDQYSGKRVFIIGKRNSGFELADGLLPWASQIILASPRPVRLSVMVHSAAAARARYIQPYEDHVLGGGNVVLDAAIARVERKGDGFVVQADGTTRPGKLTLEVDRVVAATGFTTALGDLRDLGLKTFFQDRLPAQTPYWESTTVPGIYFAGAITQGSIGLKKYGNPSSSAAVHGFRYNSRVLVRYLATRRFGVKLDRPTVAPGEAVDHLLAAVTRAPDVWNQQSYLARVLEHLEDGSLADAGSMPLAHFVDSYAGEGVAVTVETDSGGDIHPALYVRRGPKVTEHLLPSAPLHNYETKEHRTEISALLKGWI
jgi:thioredoxin reductase